MTKSLSGISWVIRDGVVLVEDKILGQGTSRTAVVHTRDGGVLLVGLCTWGDGTQSVRTLSVRNRQDMYGVLSEVGRIGVYPVTEGQVFMELTGFVQTADGKPRAIKVDADWFINLATKPLTELLSDFDVHKVGRRGDIADSTNSRRDYLAAIFDEGNLDSAVACYVLCRVLPLMAGLSITALANSTAKNENDESPEPGTVEANAHRESVGSVSIPKVNFGLTPTDEQAAIIARAGTSKDLIIEALAGTGKTSTLRMFAQASTGLKGQYLAFNKAIVVEASGSFPDHVSCRTAHGLAFAAIGHRFQRRLNQQRMKNREVAEFLDCKGFAYQSGSSRHYLTSDQLARYAWDTVRAFSRSHFEEISPALVPLPVTMNEDSEEARELCGQVLIHASKLWEDLTDPEGKMSWNRNHDIYLKLWQMSKPRIPVDFILFDEAQDADPVMLTVINDQEHAQLVYCGDDFQTLYEWRGAQNALAVAPSDERLWLTQSFRFGTGIAEIANRFLRKLQSPRVIQPNPARESRIERVDAPDAVICRTNGAVFTALVESHRAGRKAAVLGGARELRSLADACASLRAGKRTSHPDLAPFESWAEVLTWIDENPEHDPKFARDIRLIEKNSPEGIRRVLGQIVDEPQADVVISTVHQSKGREWNSVQLATDFLHPDDMEIDELRVGYVAVTRGKVQLDLNGLFTSERRERNKPQTTSSKSGRSSVKKRPRIAFKTTRRRFS